MSQKKLLKSDDEEDAEIAEAEMMNEMAAVEVLDAEERFQNEGNMEMDTERFGQQQSGQQKPGEVGERPVSQARVRNHSLLDSIKLPTDLGRFAS